MSSRIRAFIRNNALGLIALYVALGGVAVATHGDPNSISSEDIINGEVKSPDVGNDQIRSVDIRDDTSVGGGLGGVDIAADALTGADVDESTLYNDNSLTGADVDESTLYNDNSLNSADIASGAVSTDELGALPAARVRPSVNQTINSSTVTEVALGSELFDIGGLHDNADNARLTAPVDGIYSITASAALSGDPDGSRQLRVTLNDSINATLVSNQIGANPSPGFATDLTAATIAELNAGDFIRMAVHQNGAPSLTLFASRTHLAMAWIAPAP